ncbi:MAG TPA: ABC-2 family transporter protein [Verrucomicrobiae bacterium]|jgi:ABC-2 type transport system permease protein|nr:ABC-2 family transporter protein [Verrucomicrobiae bacterium]
MRKYLHVMRVGFQNTMVYRVNFLLRGAFGLIPLIATIYLWRTIYRGGHAEVAGYTLSSMISYYLIVTIVDTLTSVTDDDWQIAADIKDGNISQFLLKPINYTMYRMCLFFSGKLIFATMSLLPMGIFIFVERQYLVAPAGGMELAYFFLSLALTALLQFFMSYTMALLAFWVLEVSTIIFMLFAFEYIAGGHLFPLNILPPALEHALNFTPFPYLLFFPVTVYLGQVKGAALAQGLATQAAWTVGFFFLAQFVWARGIRKYSAVGG